MVKSFKPKSDFLSKYIKGFSTFEKGNKLTINFATFPHVGPALALFKNARLEIKKRHLNVIPTKKANYNTVVLGKYTSPVFITYNGYVDEISVNFTPLGINYFFNDHYSKIAPENFQNLRERAWIEFVPKLFSTGDGERQLEFLEDFLTGQFREKHLNGLQRCVDLFMDREIDYRVADVIDKTGMNEKTMRRQFARFLGCSPVLFKRIVRFRNAIDVKRMNKKYHSFTRLCHDSHFYDSSHFGREYRLFTERNPKSFFSGVSFVDNSEYPYFFL
jgi:AraC-like DNA-binding protein